LRLQSALGDPRPRVIPESSGSMLMSTLISPEQEFKSAEIGSTAQTNVSKETSKKSSKDDKEIQIIRSNRVIKLPPIEAPATRSKRLQAKTEMPQTNSESTKKIEKLA